MSAPLLYFIEVSMSIRPRHKVATMDIIHAVFDEFGVRWFKSEGKMGVELTNDLDENICEGTVSEFVS